MALTPRLALDDSYVMDLRCPICASSDLTVVHLSKFPDYVNCQTCQSAFVVEAGGDWIMYGKITADLPETRSFALKQWTWLDAVAKRAEDERQEQAEVFHATTPPEPEPMPQSQVGFAEPAVGEEPKPQDPQQEPVGLARPPSDTVPEAPLQEPGPATAAEIEIPGAEPDLWDEQPPVPEAPLQEPEPATAELESPALSAEPDADIAPPIEPALLPEDRREPLGPIEAELPEFSRAEAGFEGEDKAKTATPPFDLSEESPYEGEWDTLFPEEGVSVDTGPIEASLPMFDEPSAPDERATGDWADLLDEIGTETDTAPETISETLDILETMDDVEEIDDTDRLLQELRAAEPIEQPLEDSTSLDETSAADWPPHAMEETDLGLSEPAPLDYEVEKRMSSLQSEWAEIEAEPSEEEGPLKEEIEARMSALRSDAVEIDSILEDASEPEQIDLAEEPIDPEDALFAEWGGHVGEPGPEPEQVEPAVVSTVEEIEPIPEKSFADRETASDQRFRVILLGDEPTFPQEVCAHCLARPVSKQVAIPGSLPDAESSGGRKTVRFDVPLCAACLKKAEARSEDEKTDRLQSHLLSLLFGLVLIVIFLLVGVFDPAEQLTMTIVGLLVIGGVGYAIPVLLLLSRHSNHPPPPEAEQVLTTLHVQPAGTQATAFEWRNQSYAGLFRQMNRQVAEGAVTPISDSRHQARAPQESAS